MGITVLKHNAPWGPFTRAQIEEGLGRGDYTLQYLAHAPGLKEWLPLGEVLHMVDVGAIRPPLPLPRELPPAPVTPPIPPRPSVTAVPLPVSGPPALPAVAANPSPNSPQETVSEKTVVPLRKGSFFARGFAFLIDCGVLFVPIALLFILGALTIELQGWWQHTDDETMHQDWELLKRNISQLFLLMAIGFAWIYAAGLECSRWQATVGKRWMGLKVTDARGERIDFLRATGRHAAKYLSALPCFLGFMAALFSRRGLALHDRLAGTRVVRQEEP